MMYFAIIEIMGLKMVKNAKIKA